MKKDLVNGIVAAGFAVLVYAEAGRFAAGGASLARNPALYPRILAAIVCAIGVILIVRAIIAPVKAREGKRQKSTTDTKGMRYVALTVGLLIAYVGAIYLLGFVIPTLAFTLTTPMVLGTKFKTAVFVSIPVTAVLYVVFFIFFKVPIPSGILFP
jgi:putative tricarboxylic transport membrane protein